MLLLSDSTGAHFNVPLKPFHPGRWPSLLSTELDEPACGWATGWTNDSRCALEPGALDYMQSIYSKLVARNRCNHRDYQNIAVCL